MKTPFPYFLILVLLLTGLYSCDNTENILSRKDGQWNISSRRIQTFVDGVEDSDETFTSNLGGIRFAEGGTGTYLDSAGAPVGSSFTWMYEDNGLDLIQDGESTLINVVESSRSSQQWVTIIEENLLGSVYRTETTEILELVE